MRACRCCYPLHVGFIGKAEKRSRPKAAAANEKKRQQSAPAAAVDGPISEAAASKQGLVVDQHKKQRKEKVRSRHKAAAPDKKIRQQPAATTAVDESQHRQPKGEAGADPKRARTLTTCFDTCKVPGCKLPRYPANYG